MLTRSMERRFVALLREHRMATRFSIARRTVATWLNGPTSNRSRIKFCYLRGLSEETISPIADECLNHHILPDIYPGVIDSVRALDDAGLPQLMVSGGPSFLTRPLARHLGIADVIDCTPVVNGGRFTGHLDGLHPRGPNKVRTVREYLARHGYQWQDCVALADHHDDIPLLRTVARPIACNPTEQLEKVATQRGWLVVQQPLDPKELVDAAVRDFR